eukprot:3791920-Rhodomonas_salina.3
MDPRTDNPCYDGKSHPGLALPVAVAHCTSRLTVLCRASPGRHPPGLNQHVSNPQPRVDAPL